MYGWSTLPFRMEDNYKDIVSKCDLELVFLKCWAFGEVKQIRGLASIPKNRKTSSKGSAEAEPIPDVIPGNVDADNVIPHNVPAKSDHVMRKPLIPTTKKVTQRTSTRKQQNIDYSKFDVRTDEPSPLRKHRQVNLLHKPSKTVLAAHKKRKMKLPLSTRKLTTTTVQNDLVPVPQTDPVPSTSASTSDIAQPNSIGTVTVEANENETKTVIAALLSLGTDLPRPEDDITTENVSLVPINPSNPGAGNKEPVSIETSDDTKKPSDIKNTVPVHKSFLTVEYKLKRKHQCTRWFPCAQCNNSDNSYNSQKEVNQHFKETHPPVKCDYCDHSFSCPASMLKH